jgi:hypothetical protein
MSKSRKDLLEKKTNEALQEELKFLQEKNAELEKALALAKKQIAKSTIKDYLETIFDIKLDNKILTDFIMDEDKNKFITLGRPSVIGSSKSQMRHVTPY